MEFSFGACDHTLGLAMRAPLFRLLGDLGQQPGVLSGLQGFIVQVERCLHQVPKHRVLAYRVAEVGHLVDAELPLGQHDFFPERNHAWRDIDSHVVIRTGKIPQHCQRARGGLASRNGGFAAIFRRQVRGSRHVPFQGGDVPHCAGPVPYQRVVRLLLLGCKGALPGEVDAVELIVEGWKSSLFKLEQGRMVVVTIAQRVVLLDCRLVRIQQRLRQAVAQRCQPLQVGKASRRLEVGLGHNQLKRIRRFEGILHVSVQPLGQRLHEIAPHRCLQGHFQSAHGRLKYSVGRYPFCNSPL
mmetsp:Transcript_25295/g.70860  ORF Transcript_25295/g.70860 Transcript_25295/m.70860 type:complete len:298 (-) Transcript_25295:131-1024(-)